MARVTRVNDSECEISTVTNKVQELDTVEGSEDPEDFEQRPIEEFLPSKNDDKESQSTDESNNDQLLGRLRDQSKLIEAMTREIEDLKSQLHEAVKEKEIMYAQHGAEREASAEVMGGLSKVIRQQQLHPDYRDDVGSVQDRNILEELDAVKAGKLLLGNKCEEQELTNETLKREKARDDDLLKEAKQKIADLKSELKDRNWKTVREISLEKQVESLKEEQKKTETIIFDMKNKFHSASPPSRFLRNNSLSPLYPWKTDRNLYQRSGEGEKSGHSGSSVGSQEMDAVQEIDDNSSLDYSTEPSSADGEHSNDEYGFELQSKKGIDQNETRAETPSRDTSPASFFLDGCDDSTLSSSSFQEEIKGIAKHTSEKNPFNNILLPATDTIEFAGMSGSNTFLSQADTRVVIDDWEFFTERMSL